MKANELRIGNLFSGYNGVIFEWDCSCFELCEKGIEVDEIGLSIPLTKEWLSKFGFEFVFGINNRYLKDYGSFYFTIMIMNDDKSYRVSLSNHKKKEGETIPIIGLGIIKYVHQLQNLYFALTNEELIINK